jgi:hypothetical protein
MSQSTLTRLALVAAALTAIVAIAGCGGDSAPEEIVLAEVGDREVTLDYYADRLARMKQDQLPRDESGQPYDMTTLEGKRRFLDVIIDKELMVAKALDLGIDRDPAVESAYERLIEYHGIGTMWLDEIGNPSRYVSEEDFDYYYSRLGERRDCDFIITDFKADAEAALAEFREGADWSDLVAKYHVGRIIDGRDPRLSVPWGHYRDSFEQPVFAAEVGDVAGPIETEYGWWLVRVKDVVMEPKPDAEEIKDSVLQSIAQRNQNLRREELMETTRQERNFMIDEEALAIVFDGLPENQDIIDPDTNQPVPRDQLAPLDVPRDSYSRVLMSYELTTGEKVVTIGDFKSRYDQQSAFERVRKSDLLGGVRNKLVGEASMEIMVDESVRRGYREDPRAMKEASRQLEEMLVEKIHTDIVTYDEKVTQEQLEEFFEEYGHQYDKPERRSGQMVQCADLATAERARKAVVEDGATWKMVNERFGNDAELRQRFGRIMQMRADQTGAVRDKLFSLDVDEISEPFPTENGFAVVMLTQIHEPETATMEEIVDVLERRIKSRRQDQALRELLDQWREDYAVVVHEDRLAEAPSWQEAVDAALAEKLALPES